LSSIRTGIAELSARKILILLMLLALVLRIISALTREAIQLDETVYAHMAEALANGFGPRDITGINSTNFLPTFPFFIAGIAAIFQDYVLSGYIVTITFGVLLLIPVYLLGKELVGEKTGLAAAALIAVNPYLVEISSTIYSESLYMFFILLAILFSRHMVRGCRVPCSILAGSSLGFAYLVNPFALIYLAIFIIVAFAISIKRGVWIHMVKALGVFLVSFFIYVTPLILYLHSETGEWTYTGKNPTIVYAALENTRSGTIGWDQRFLQLNEANDNVIINEIETEYPGPARALLEDPARTANTFMQQANIFYDEKFQDVIPRWLLPLMALGLFATGWNRKRAAQVGFILLMVSPALILLVTDSVSRYFISYTPLLMIWAAMGWLKLQDWGTETVELSFEGSRREQLLSYVAPVVALVVIIPMIIATPLMLIKREYPLTAREAGEWIEREHGDGSRIMSREYTSSYYAGGEVVLFPYDDYNKTSEYARHQGVDFLVATRNDIEYWRSPLADLLLDESRHPEWELVHVVGAGGDDEKLIFRFNG
jgi:4-amino-4-deoxy-L-arabinose transferase-like glycosyltransferase